MPAISFKNDNNFTNISDGSIKNKFENYISSGLTYSFDYEKIQSGYDVEDNTDDVQAFPIRGIGAILIMLSAVFAAVRFQTDDKNGLHKRLSTSSRFFAAILNVFSVVVLVSLSVFLAIVLSNTFTDVYSETIMSVLYVAISTLFGTILAFLIPNTAILVSLTPLLAIGAIIFCPVFIDAESVMPVIGIINKIFIPNGYLTYFYGNGILVALCTLLILIFISFLFYLKEK